MSQSLKVHSVWLSVSLLSFIIGFKFFPSSSENDNSAFKKNVQLTTIGKDDVSKSSGGLTNKKEDSLFKFKSKFSNCFFDYKIALAIHNNNLYEKYRDKNSNKILKLV